MAIAFNQSVVIDTVTALTIDLSSFSSILTVNPYSVDFFSDGNAATGFSFTDSADLATFTVDTTSGGAAIPTGNYPVVITDDDGNSIVYAVSVIAVPNGTEVVLTGTANADALAIPTSADSLNFSGLAGNDTLVGGTKNDILNGDGDNDSLIGNGGDDVLNGGAGADNLNGGADNDILDGGTGNDQLIGGAGDDTYFLDSTGDIVTEGTGSGTDTVYFYTSTAPKTYTLTTNVENLLLLGSNTDALNGTGNASDNTIVGNTGNNVLSGLAGNDNLIGGDGNDSLNGGAGSDWLSGGAGDDIFVVTDLTDNINGDANGTAGDTVQFGGTVAGTTFVLGTNSTNVENLTLTGSAAINGTGDGNDNIIIGNTGNNTLNGAAGVDTLSGGAGNDTLDGGTGDDSMAGGTGNDVYFADAPGDVVTEGANAGTDTVFFTSTIDGETFDLTATPGSANVENLTLLGAAAINGTGNSLANVLTGNDGDNTLIGGSGNDTLNGGDLGTDVLEGGTGNDTYVINSGVTFTNVTITELTGGGTDLVRSNVTVTLSSFVENLTLLGIGNIDGTGNTLANVITGNSGGNSLDDGGGTGKDSLIGGAGDDNYTISVVGAVVTELAGGGTDTVATSVNYTLAANVENLNLLTGATIGTGNTLNNVIDASALSTSATLNGAAGVDMLTGGSGDDTFIVDTVTDSITGGGGVDTIQSSVTFDLSNALVTGVQKLTLTGSSAINGTGVDGSKNTLTGNTGNNTLTGKDGDDTLIGNAGNDVLDGGAGADSLVGGVGNDTYFVDDAGDVVLELANGGTDTVNSSVDFILGGNVENLTLTGTAASGTGNSVANVITGNSTASTLSGLGGNDSLTGGSAADILIGGIGKDSLTGAGGADFFDYSVRTDSLLSGYDVTDFGADSGDKFIAVVNTTGTFTVASGGTVTALTEVEIQNAFGTSLTAFGVGTFTSGSNQFVILNDGAVGFNASADAVIQVSSSFNLANLTAANFQLPFS